MVSCSLHRTQLTSSPKSRLSPSFSLAWISARAFREGVSAPALPSGVPGTSLAASPAKAACFAARLCIIRARLARAACLRLSRSPEGELEAPASCCACSARSLVSASLVTRECSPSELSVCPMSARSGASIPLDSSRSRSPRMERAWCSSPLSLLSGEQSEERKRDNRSCHSPEVEHSQSKTRMDSVQMPFEVPFAVPFEAPLEPPSTEARFCAAS